MRLAKLGSTITTDDMPIQALREKYRVREENLRAGCKGLSITQKEKSRT